MGLATAELLLSSGVAVSFIDTRADLADPLKSGRADGRVFFFQGDIRERDAVRSAMAGATQRFGPIDGAFFSAGVHCTGTVLDVTDANWNYVVSTNLRGLIYCLQHCLPHMMQGGGSIVLMGSDQTFVGKPNSFLYGMTKGAIGQMTKTLALDFAPHKIRVNSVCPGTVRTPMAEDAIQRWAASDFGGNSNAAWEKEATFFPMRRVGLPREIARVVVFLLSDASSFMTGTNVAVDGGYTAQ
jgi:NAD(P)-dependent dehydrogenase (short-subunit alcohol dehydrogenase family)